MAFIPLRSIEITDLGNTYTLSHLAEQSTVDTLSGEVNNKVDKTADVILFPLIVSGSTASLYDGDNLQIGFDAWYTIYSKQQRSEIVRPMSSTVALVFTPVYVDSSSKAVVLCAVYNGEIHVASLQNTNNNLVGTYTVTSLGGSYTAGDGIDITNGVISVNYPNGDSQSY